MIRGLQAVVKRGMLQPRSRFEQRLFRINCSILLKEHYENKQRGAEDIYHHEQFSQKQIPQENARESLKESEKFHDLPPRSVDQILSEVGRTNNPAEPRVAVSEKLEEVRAKQTDEQVEKGPVSDSSKKTSFKTWMQNLQPLARLNKYEVQETSSEFFKDQYSRTTKAVGKVLRWG
eukprot:745886-Hanusia_phi.AAC.7